MRFTCSGKTYKVSFKHIPQTNPSVRMSKTLSAEFMDADMTECIIRNADGNSATFIGRVKRHSNDAPNRVIARKLAFEKALQTMKLQKSDRQEAWKMYKDQVRIK